MKSIINEYYVNKTQYQKAEEKVVKWINNVSNILYNTVVHDKFVHTTYKYKTQIKHTFKQMQSLKIKILLRAKHFILNLVWNY